MRRAYRPDQKESRKQAILETAVKLFEETRYQDLHMADLAARVGLAKGTLYLYFPTKESLFLAVLMTEMGAWFQGAGARLEALEKPILPREAADLLVDEMLRLPLLPGLQALVHNVLEQNVPEEEAVAFGKFLREGVDRVAGPLEKAVEGLSRPQAATFLVRFYGMVIGAQHMASRPPAIREALSRAVALAERDGCDVVLATDPDCDRMGCAVRSLKPQALSNGAAASNSRPRF